MKSITNAEMLFVLRIFKSPEQEYNANSIAKQLGISAMGALKIGKRLEKEGILNSRKVGKASIYQINFDSKYARFYVTFALQREAQQAPPYVRRWIEEVRKLNTAKVAILFGSVLHKQKEARDIDVLLIMDTDKKQFAKLQKQVETINSMNPKKIHPVYQTETDLRKHIKEKQGVVLNALKGIVVFGEAVLMEALA